ISQIRLNATQNQNIITYPVMLSVPNPDEKLRPQMTANVSIDVAQVKDALRVPNAALRFRPTGAGEEGGGRGGGTRGGGGGAAGSGAGAGAGPGGGAGVEERAARMASRGQQGGGFTAAAGELA